MELKLLCKEAPGSNNLYFKHSVTKLLKMSLRVLGK